jgi:uncharacterized protein YecT (DUF1311 family)
MKKVTWILTASLLLLVSASPATKPRTKPLPAPADDPIRPELREQVDLYAKADKEMNRVYRELKAALPEDKREDLRTAQRAWLKFRDEEAELEAEGAGWGWDASWNSRLASLTEARTKQLHEFMPEGMQGDEHALGLTIAVPAMETSSERMVVAVDRNSHFSVILTNLSKRTQWIITPWSSWGDRALRFEITDRSGKKTVARTVANDHVKNLPHWWVLEPQECVVFDVYFADEKRWEGFPHLTHYGDAEAVTLRAVFEVTPDKEKPAVDAKWAGSVSSKPERVAFCNQIPEK